MSRNGPASPLAVEVLGLSYSYPRSETETLRDLSLRVRTGECVCISGPSGCGKSTLLLAMAGLLKGGSIRGKCVLGADAPGSYAGIVFQNAESQILTTTVGDEVAFGPTNMNLQDGEIERRVASALSAVGLSGFETRNVEGLSAGEKHRLTLASVLSMEPLLLFLDEPSAQLDRQGKEALRAVLKDLKKRSFTIIIADHDLWAYKEVADRFIFMNGGRIVGETDRVPTEEIEHPRSRGRQRTNAAESQTDRVIALSEVCFSHEASRPVIADLSLSVLAGDLVHIYGENGAGKSTLFKLMTGLLRPDSGRIDILGLAQPTPEKLKGKVGLLLQNPVRQLFENTVGEEAAFALKRQGLLAPEIDGRVTDALFVCALTHLRGRSPFALSFGEKHRVTLASLMASRPRVLLLDEPFSGLDFAFRRRMLETLQVYGEEQECAIVVATHDSLVDPDWADRSFVLKDGRLAEMCVP